MLQRIAIYLVVLLVMMLSVLAWSQPKQPKKHAKIKSAWKNSAWMNSAWMNTIPRSSVSSHDTLPWYCYVNYFPRIDASNIGGRYQSDSNAASLLLIDSVVKDTTNTRFRGVYSRITVADGKNIVTQHGHLRGGSLLTTLPGGRKLSLDALHAWVEFEQWDTAQYPPTRGKLIDAKTIQLTSKHSSYRKLLRE